MSHLGRKIVSGVRAKATNVLIEHTDKDGFISQKFVNSVRNQPTMQGVLRRHGYMPIYANGGLLKGYQIAHMIKP